MKLKKLSKKLSHLLAIATITLPNLTSWPAIADTTTTPSTVIQPNYADDEERAHADNSWAIDNQTDVVNHTGNPVSGANVFEASMSNTGDENNFSTNYINYNGGQFGPDYSIRQFARQTTTPGLYDVFTNIRGNKQRSFEPLSIVLISDHSSSMETVVDGHSRMYYLDQAIENFVDTIQTVMTENGMDQDLIRVGNVAYGNTLYNSGTRYVPIGNMSTNATLLKNATPTDPDANQGTFTQTGLREAGNMLGASSEAGRKKVAILVTDGVPTLSNRITTANDTNNNSEIEIGEVTATTTTQNAVLGSNTFAHNVTNPGTYPIDGSGSRAGLSSRHLFGATTGPVYNSVFPATLYQSQQLKDAGIEVQGIGIEMPEDDNYTAAGEGGTNPYWPAFTNNQILTLMKQLVTNDELFQNVINPAELTAYLRKNLLDLLSTVQSGTAQIKIGNQFEIEPNSLSTQYFEGQTASTAQSYTATYDDSNKTINLDNLNLGQNEQEQFQEIQIHHQVRIQTERIDFSPDTWRFISDPDQTYFVPNPAIDSTQLPFAVPSGRAPGTTIDLTKVWQDMAAENASRPDSIELEIQRDTTVNSGSWQTANYLLAGNKTGDRWTATGIDSLTLDGGEAKVALPLFNNNGENFTYKIVSENGANAYSSSISQDGKTITNTERWQFELIKQSNEDASPAGAAFELKTAAGDVVNTGTSNADGLVIWDIKDFRFSKNTTYHLTETTALPAHNVAGPWTISVSANNTISMSADDENDEDSVYIAIYDEDSATFRVTLVNHRDVKQLNGTKTWVGDSGQEQFRPDHITVELYQNGNLYREIKVPAPSLSEGEISDTWDYDLGLVPVKDLDGNDYEYTVKEITVPHYASEVDGLDISNTLDLINIDINVTKIWEDNNNRAGHRPDSITFQLYQDDEEYGEPVELEGDMQASQWTYTFNNLPEYKNATEKYTYEIRELNVSERYTDEIVKVDDETVNITNTFVPELTDISGQKIWDEDTPDQFMPEEITVELWAYPADEDTDSAPMLIDTQAVSADNNWIYQFTDLPKEDKDGREINYQVREVSIANFSPQYHDDNDELGPFDIQNIFTPNTRDISVTKSWINYDNVLGIRPDSVTVELLRDGEVFLTSTVTADNDWTYTFENLPVYRSSALDEYVYSVREVNVPASYQEGDDNPDDFNLTNTLVETKAVTGDKTWLGDEDVAVVSRCSSGAMATTRWAKLT